MNKEVINWLLEDSNPAIKYRTQTELLGQTADVSQAKEWIYSKLPKEWYNTKGLWYVYYVTALAQCGLSKDDISSEHMRSAFDVLSDTFECSCSDFMLLTALVQLGYNVQNTIDNLIEHSLPDGGFLCLHRVNKLEYVPKSCYKANLHALMFLAECKKRDIDISSFQPLISYFINRNIFYKSSGKTSLVLNNREGWRTIDVFYPFEVMRIGLQNIVESFSALGYGNEDWLQKSWRLLEKQKDDTGKVILGGTLTKSYLPKEKIGKASKWATFYTLLAESNRGNSFALDIAQGDVMR